MTINNHPARLIVASLATLFIFQMPIVLADNLPTKPCGVTPEGGTTSVFDEVAMQRADIQHGNLLLKNHLPSKAVALLMDASMSHKLQVFTVDAGGEVQISVPVGYYGFGILAG